MDDFQRYLDLYTPGDRVLTDAQHGRVRPHHHAEWFINVPFPVMRTGLNGFGVIGQPLGRPSAASFGPGIEAPPPVWLQRWFNARGTPLVVDGRAGQATLAAVTALWDRARAGVGAAAFGTTPPTLVTTTDGQRTVAMPRALLQAMVDQNLSQVADPPNSLCGAETNGFCRPLAAPDPVIPVIPVPDVPLIASTSSSAGGIALIAAAVVLGLWYARS